MFIVVEVKNTNETFCFRLTEPQIFKISLLLILPISLLLLLRSRVSAIPEDRRGSLRLLRLRRRLNALEIDNIHWIIS